MPNKRRDECRPPRVSNRMSPDRSCESPRDASLVTRRSLVIDGALGKLLGGIQGYLCNFDEVFMYPTATSNSEESELPRTIPDDGWLVFPQVIEHRPRLRRFQPLGLKHGHLPFTE
jgi:hypothetical protein